MTQAIIFDCDGVIVDSEAIALEVHIAFLAEIGLPYERAEFVARMGRTEKDFFAGLDADAKEKLGRSILAELEGEMTERKRIAMDALTEISGATAAITELKRPKAVASSSTGKALERKLRHVGLFDHFAPHIYSADHVTRSKPEPDLFLHAAKNLDVKPTECLVIEDSVNGVLAARSAGMRVWGFLGGGHMDKSTGSKLTAAGAERLVPEWSQFLPMLES